jgi:hypothetical protein
LRTWLCIFSFCVHADMAVAASAATTDEALRARRVRARPEARTEASI